MAKTTRKLMSALAVSATLLTARAATAADAADRATIVLHVDDFSGLPADDLHAAEAVAIVAPHQGARRAERAPGRLSTTALVAFTSEQTAASRARVTSAN